MTLIIAIESVQGLQLTPAGWIAAECIAGAAWPDGGTSDASAITGARS
jgi:hypothetical protein